MAEVLISTAAREELRDLPPDVQTRMKNKLREAADNPDHFLKPLSGRDTFRVRAGDYRAEVEWDRQAETLKVLKIGHRDGFYR